MPRKSKKKSSSLDVSVPKLKRGRPRKTVAPEALTPFGEHELATIEKSKRLEKKPEPVVEKPNSRRMNPTTSDRHYSSDEVEFMNALAEFKRASGRTFPTCSEILSVLRCLGYEKVTYELSENVSKFPDTCQNQKQ
jgi:hypothetical protein